MVFFPSYKMMEQVCDVFLEKCQSDPSCETETLIQQPGMKEEERESFLQAFSEELSGERKGSLAAFCVMGGIFGEGIIKCCSRNLSISDFTKNTIFHL